MAGAGCGVGIGTVPKGGPSFCLGIETTRDVSKTCLGMEMRRGLARYESVGLLRVGSLVAPDMGAVKYWTLIWEFGPWTSVMGL